MCSQGREGWWVKMCLEKRQNLKIGIRAGLKWPNEQFHVALLQSELGLWHIGAIQTECSEVNQQDCINKVMHLCTVCKFLCLSCSSCSHSQQSTSFIIFFLVDTVACSPASFLFFRRGAAPQLPSLPLNALN